MTVDSQQSYVVLSKLSAGSSYIITVTTTQGRAQSDALTSIMTTGIQFRELIVTQLLFLSVKNCINHTMDFLLPAVPAPPTHLRIVNVTDTRAVLQWTPSLGKVDRFIISYESSKSECGIVTLMANDRELITEPCVLILFFCQSS